jgi:uncharacterized protein
MNTPSEIIITQNFEKARHYAAHRLEHELSPKLLYHGFAHTRDEVVPSAELLAGMEGVYGESLDLLRTAAWYHDIGFIEQPPNHEMISARIAVDVLPGFGYTDSQIEIVKGAILATTIPQSPTSILEKIVADADLNVLGRKDFLQRNNDLRRELAFFGKEYSDVEWFTGQLKFIKKHTFFTASALALLNGQKLLNIAAMENVLMALSR